MSKIEKYLHEHFASLAENADDTDTATSNAAAAPSSNTPLRDYIPEALDEPFAKVNTVAANSPAATAGVQAGDLIRNFGWVNKSNHDGLKKVAECVQGNEGVSGWCSSPTVGATQTDTSTAAQCPCKGLENKCRTLSARATVDVGATARLGRERAFGLPHSAS